MINDLWYISHPNLSLFLVQTPLPEFTPPAISTDHPQRQHRIDVIGIPAGTGNFEPLLRNIAMGTFDLARPKWPAALMIGAIIHTIFKAGDMVDQATQRAAWAYGDAPEDGLVLETSLYNLTEPGCTALAHPDPLTTEVWQLVRLDQPTEPAPPAAQQGAKALPPAPK